MFQKYKNKITVLLMALVLSASTLAPQRSHAVIGGIATGAGHPYVGVPILVLGAVVGGVGIHYISYLADDDPNAEEATDDLARILVGVFFGIPIFMAGVLFLDDHTVINASSVQFSELNDAQAAQAGLSLVEKDQFNSTLDLLKAAQANCEAAVNQSGLAHEGIVDQANIAAATQVVKDCWAEQAQIFGMGTSVSIYAAKVFH